MGAKIINQVKYTVVMSQFLPSEKHKFKPRKMYYVF